MILKLETISPVHIGNGNEISPMEYHVDEVFTRVDLDSLIKDEVFGRYQEKFMIGAGTSRYIGQYIPPTLLVSHASYQVPFTPEAHMHLSNNPILVKEFYKSAGRVLIPGSSVKGSILSAVVFEVLNSLWREETSRDSIIKLLRKKEDRFSHNELLDMVLSFVCTSSGQGKRDRFSRWIDVSDSSMGLPDQNLRIFLTKVDGARGRSALPIVCEALDSGKEFFLEIKTEKYLRYPIENILSQTDHFYRMVWNKTNPGKPLTEEGTLLRIGQGSSAYSTSLLLFAEVNKIGQETYPHLPPRTSKKVEGDGNMGWIILKTSQEKSIFKPVKFPDRPHISVEKASQPAGVRPETDESHTEIWENGLLTYDPGSQTLSVQFAKKKAFAKGKEVVMSLVPVELHNKILGKKRKPVRALVTVATNSFRILKIEIIP